MSDTDTLAHLMKGISEDDFQILLTGEPISVTSFVTEHKKLEDVQRRRMHLPNMVPAMLPFGTCSLLLDVRSILGDVISEEFQLLPTLCSLSLVP